jgi:hypothetical protein
MVHSPGQTDERFGTTRAPKKWLRGRLSLKWKKNVMDQEPEVLVAPDQVERRRHTRYGLKERIFIRRENGSVCPATTSEISIGGLSATTTEYLLIGEEVRLSPVAGEQVSAIVRRKVGNIYGFEFTDTTLLPKVVQQIHILCRGLVPFRGLPED